MILAFGLMRIIGVINNGESGLSVRSKLNTLIGDVDTLKDQSLLKTGDPSGDEIALFVGVGSTGLKGSGVTINDLATATQGVLAETAVQPEDLSSVALTGLYSDLIDQPTLGSISTQNSDSVSVTGGTITGITDLNIADGGTGASDAATARTNLGAQATVTGAASTITSSDLTADRALVSNALGKVEVSAVTAVELGYVSGVTSGIQSQLNNRQPLNTNLTSVASLGTTSGQMLYTTAASTWAESPITGFGRSLIDDVDSASGRGTLGLGTIATQAANSVAITGGSVDGVTVGGTTPSTGVFTTLAATTSLTTPLVTHPGDLSLSATGANALLFSTDGSERLRVNPSGNVGVGTSTPEVKLDVNGSIKYTFSSGGVGLFGGVGFNMTSEGNRFLPQILAHNAFDNTDDEGGPYWNSRKTRGLTGAANAGQSLGTFIFTSTDTGGTVRNAASFSGVSAGAGAATHAGQLVFRTTSMSDFGPVERLRVTAEGKVGVGTTSPASMLSVAGQISGKFSDVGTNTAAQDLENNLVSQVTISANTTLTTTVPPAGAHATVIVITSGTSSRTVTFGTGFAATGTLATGTASGRRFVMSFVSDGTRLLEASRTISIAV
jgi:hypothetical protein